MLTVPQMEVHKPQVDFDLLVTVGSQGPIS
jgi:hypothetical protein